jgi:hypothetical protein
LSSEVERDEPLGAIAVYTIVLRDRTQRKVLEVLEGRQSLMHNARLEQCSSILWPYQSFYVSSGPPGEILLQFRVRQRSEIGVDVR